MKNDNIGISWEGFDASKASENVLFQPNIKILFPSDVNRVTITCENTQGNKFSRVISLDSDGKGWTSESNCMSQESPIQAKWSRPYDKPPFDPRDNWYICSNCGRSVNVICGKTLEDYPYCHCGAKMTVDSNNKY